MSGAARDQCLGDGALTDGLGLSSSPSVGYVYQTVDRYGHVGGEPTTAGSPRRFPRAAIRCALVPHLNGTTQKREPSAHRTTARNLEEDMSRTKEVQNKHLSSRPSILSSTRETTWRL